MDLDVLLEPVPDRGSEPCKVGRILASLEDPYRTALWGLLSTQIEDGGLSAEQLQVRMTKAGVPVGASAIRRHRAKRCTCESVVFV